MKNEEQKKWLDQSASLLGGTKSSSFEKVAKTKGVAKGGQAVEQVSTLPEIEVIPC